MIHLHGMTMIIRPPLRRIALPQFLDGVSQGNLYTNLPKGESI